MFFKELYILFSLLIIYAKSDQEGYKWVPGVFNKAIPENAIVGGHAEDHNMVFKEYIARGRHEDEIIPGKLGNPKLINYPPKVLVHVYGDHKFVDTTLVGGDFHCLYNDKEQWKPEFEILIGPDQFQWISISPETAIPPNAIQAGNKKDGTIYYVGRAKHDGKNKEVGKVDGSDKKLYTSLGGHVKIWAYYEILTWNTDLGKKTIPLINTISVYYGNHNWIIPDDKQNAILNNETSTVTKTQNQSGSSDPIIDKLLRGISDNANKNFTLVDHLKIYQGNHNWIFYKDEDATKVPSTNTDSDPDKPSYPLNFDARFNAPDAE